MVDVQLYPFLYTMNQTASTPSYLRIGGILFVFFILGFSAYSPVVGGFFLSDDFHYLHDINLHGLKAVWKIFPRDFFRPMVMFSFWVDTCLWNMSSWGYHVSNIVIHIVNSLWVAFIFRQWMHSSSGANRSWNSFALVAGLIYLLHPSHTEAVSWISGRSDVIATFWLLASLSCYFWYRQSNRLTAVLISCALFFFALLTKEFSITLLPMVTIVELTRHDSGSTWSKKFCILLFYLLVLVIYLPFRWEMIGHIIGGYGQSVHLVWNKDLLHRNFLFFTTRAVLAPTDWQINEYVFVYGKKVLYALLILLHGFIFARLLGKVGKIPWLLWIRLPYTFLILFGVYTVSLVPVMNLTIHLDNSLGERFIYWPTVFTTFMLVYLAGVLFNRWRRMGIVLLTSLSLVYGVALFQANLTWYKAGEIARDIIHDIKAFSTNGRVFLLNVPDHLKGAYLFRNGIQPAVSDFAEYHPQIIPVVFQTLTETDQEITLSKKGAHTFRIQTHDPQAYFMRRASVAFLQSDITITTFSSTEMEVTIRNPQPGDVMAYFSGGHVHAIP